LTRKKLYVPVVGGLGNQLFCLAYSLMLYEKGYSPILLPTLTNLQMRNHKKKEKLVEDLGSLREILGVAGKLEAILVHISIRVIRFLSVALGKKEGLIDNRAETYNVNLPSEHAFVVQGYFQNPSTYLLLTNRTRGLLNAFLLEGSKKTESHEIVMHYRRGDYANHKDSIGLLDDRYFISAAIKARSMTGIESVRIYSDGDPSQIVAGLKNEGMESTICNDLDISPRKLLAKMAGSGSVFITSNSSLSWWAAALSRSSVVFYPKKWFRNIQDIGMGLPGWIAEDSVWVA
jgi:hypothetical protein